jgi:hypothetical protein
LSIHLLLSLRAARRRRDQHFTSPRPGRTTRGATRGALAAIPAIGWLAVAAAAIAVAALALAWSLQPLVHDDLFWHLRTGEWIAAHHRVPLTDLFSYTRYGARWITHEWGFSLASWLLYEAAGAAGLVAATPLLALAIFAAVAGRAVDLAGAAREESARAERAVEAARDDPAAVVDGRSVEVAATAASTGAPAAASQTPGSSAEPAGGAQDAGAASPMVRFLLLLALLALGLWAASPELFLRAALAGELLLALVLAALARWRRTGRSRWLAALALHFLIWANVHSGVLFGLCVLALYALGPAVVAAVRRWRRAARHGAAPDEGRGPAPGESPPEASSRAARPLWVALAAALVLVLLNPNGLDAPLYPLLLGRILYASGIPWELGHFSAAAPAGGAANAPLWLLLVLLLLALLPLRQARRLSPAEGASIASFFLLTLLSHRFVFDLVVIALPSLYKLLVLPPPPAPQPAASLPGRLGSPSRLGLAGRPGLAAAVVALFLLPIGPAAIARTAAGWARRPPARGGLIAEHLPRAAARFIAAQGIAGPGGRIFNHQNWGGFAGWSLRVPVFWDGRNDVFAELVREVAASPFEATARRHRFDYLLIAEHDYPGIQPDVAAGRWGLVYWDDFAAVYLRRGPRHAALLRRLELRLFPPFGGRPGLAALAADPVRAAAARAELARVLAANPANQRARYFAGMISLYRGELRRGVQELRAAARIRPNDQVEETLDRLRRLPAPP